jgi:predicted nucleotidyltransferase
MTDPLVERLRDHIRRLMEVTALIWFGSRAAGRGDGRSDYDFIVVSPEFDGVRFLTRPGKLESLREPRVAYDFLCYTPDEFEKMAKRMTIVREAVESGIRII